MPFHHLLPERYRGPNARVATAPAPPTTIPGTPTSRSQKSRS
ncbi:MAG: hypothetical protein WAT36_05575 [Chromatiaceae bacterium]